MSTSPPTHPGSAGHRGRRRQHHHRGRAGSLGDHYTHDDGLSVDALTVHFKSKLLSFPGRTPGQTRFNTQDESERARYGLYALDQRATEAVTARFWATTALADNGTRRNVLLLGDLNDPPEAATTQLLLGPRDRR